MTLHYRETDPVSARWSANTGGVKLSSFQGDENIYTLNAAIAAVAATVTPSRSISSITMSLANELTFHMSDSTLEGPFTIQFAPLNPRGAWLASTAYAVNDAFYINGTAYLVIFADPGQSSFDAGANDGLGHNYFAVILPNPGNALPTGGATAQVLEKSSGTDFAVTWGWKLPTGGSARQSLIKQSSTNQDAIWDNVHSLDVSFSPSTASGLTSTNVSAALEEIEARVTTYSAGTGLVLTGSTFSIDGSIVGRLATANTWALAQTFTLAPVFTDATGTRTALGLAIGTDVQAFDADLAALAANSSNGLWTHTGAGTGSARTLAAGNGITVTNGDGVSGNPTIAQSSNAQIDVIEFVIDGGGSTITTGMKGYIEVPFAATISQATLLADQSGSIVVDVFKCTYSQFDAGSTHPVSGDKITASAPPTISSATKAQDATLTGWTTSISAGDILAFNVNSVTTIQRVTISLKVAHV